MTFLIIAKEMGGMTSRLLENIGAEYKYVACRCQESNFDQSKTLFYECHGIHGSAVARKEALKMHGDYVVLDDDYSCFQYDGYADQKWNKTKRYISSSDVGQVIEKMRRLEQIDGHIIVGGYSSGSLCGYKQRIKKNIMQIYISDRLEPFFRDESDLYRLNDDVCACMIANRMGYLTLGLWGVMRVTQQPEQTDNTNSYDCRSWAKSYMPVLYYPAAARISFSNERELSGGVMRPMRFHHRVEWSKIVPIVVERRSK